MSILETEYHEKAYGKTRFDEGYDEGVQAGIEQGLEKGLEQGLEQGKQSEKIETIFAMSKDNIPVETIAKYTRLTVEKVNIILSISK